MKSRSLVLLLTAILLAAPAAAQDDGFETIFDGKSLEGWDGNPDFWRVEEGALTGQTTTDKPTKGNTFIVWRKGELEDFELRLEYRIVGGNSGIQYRSFEVPNEKWVIGGYQADIDSGDTYSGINYGERFRGVLALRGQETVIQADHKPKEVKRFADGAELQKKIKKDDWNEYHISAKGFHFEHRINGELMSVCTDEDAEQRRAKGVLALQLHAGPPMKVQFRNIRLKRLPSSGSQSSASGPRKKVVFVSGRPSHAYGDHEHYAGCTLLANALQRSNVAVTAEVVKHGWPADSSVFNGADAIVMYSDGGAGHMAIPHLKEVDALAKKGVGIVCIHYAVEVPAGDPGKHFLDWIGGYFEMNWSVNPHWTAKFTKFPDHPIARGVKPFEINDEWYYHMRFRPNLEGVTPILTDLPPDSSLSRGDGPHSGNPHVRAAVLQRKEPQHVAWASERPDGGRGFGFTGGHVHWNWGDPNFRKVMLNAIVWTAKGEVPANGVEDAAPTFEQLEKNLDKTAPANFDRDRILREKNLKSEKAAARSAPGTLQVAATNEAASRRAAMPIWSSKLVTAQTPGHAVPVDVEITKAKKLFLVVTDGGNGFSCDWADWAEPRLVGPAGQKKLTELPWKSASSQWGEVRVNKNAEGGQLRIAGKTVEYGIGTHANSVIEFDLPEGYDRFQARAGLDNGGTDQAGGQSTSVEFLVFTQRPPADIGSGSLPNNSHRADEALAGLDVGEGLEATLFAAEPILLNPTNIEIDHLGRVWVCEVLNYRRFANNQHPERTAGDRIVILEDSNGDGIADKQSVFYQGRDIDSAHGICLLATPSGKGTRVLISANDSVFYLIDDDGDLKADRKELLFTGIAGAQHDHGIHAMVFGPDGRLYFNFGNEGRRIKDKDGKPIVDLAGNEVNDSLKPYQQGMVFRCRLDGSQFETLGWNFRNNWEVAVDSFGTLWQSDNDDDGNRGVRINFVMEFGNYGYRDERTGAGWMDQWKLAQSRGVPEELRPHYHWHQFEPGVVPNLLQTGAGSPTGICVYEGDLLPPQYRNQIMHCDAGPNVVRCYPAQPAGAGYRAEMLNVLHGARDNWFRPSDVCVAPDGSLLVADWYDPGVGGHRMQDVERGRLFRVAPPGAPYRVPKFDFATPAGAWNALRSPNHAVRYMAWTALRDFGAAAEPVLKTAYESEANPRFQARALWLLAQRPDKGAACVDSALSNSNSDLRIVGIRLARQLKRDLADVARKMASDPSPQVRREVAIAIRFLPAAVKGPIWKQLADQYDGQDRWYLEALGIAAGADWDACLETWLAGNSQPWKTAAGREILWRSRGTATAALLAKAIGDSAVKADEVPRYVRAFDFLPDDGKDEALTQLAFAPSGDPRKAQAIHVAALGRVKGFDIGKNPAHRAALDQALDSLKNQPEFVSLVDKFHVTARHAELLALAIAQPDGQLGVDAVRVLLKKGDLAGIDAKLRGADEVAARDIAIAVGNSGDPASYGLLSAVLKSDTAGSDVKRYAIRGLTRTRRGAAEVLGQLSDKKLDETLVSAAIAALHTCPFEDLKQQALKLFPPPAAKDRPIPPVTELLKMRGDVARGSVVFQKSAECAKCHVVNGQGKEVGPNLSEIGAKLSKPAFFESILYPSAGISHSFETYAAVTTSGSVFTGIKVSETEQTVTLKNAEALAQTFQKSELEELKKLATSLMPADLQKTMTTQDLVDVVEYLTTLKK